MAGKLRIFNSKVIWLAAVLYVLGWMAPAALAQTPANSTGNPAAQVIEYTENRPANFVFLVDVSGSIVSPRTNVKALDGSTITLFEALRQALKQIVGDTRVLSADSKVAFITFGTAITEKSDWPTNLKEPESRSALLAKISSPEELQADKHGDTYMAGGLAKAYKKVLEFEKDSPPCTTNFIIMLTDGWDEPPANAEYHIADVATLIQEKQKEKIRALGVNTWQVRVVGLQRLPDKKAGTKTASEVATLIGGRFLDVTKAKGGTVAQQIYAALAKTIDELKGEIDLPQLSSPEGIVNFGTLKDSSTLFSSVPATNRSCYVEKITGIAETSKTVKSQDLNAALAAVKRECAAGRIKDLPDGGASVVPLSHINAGAVKLELKSKDALLAPLDRSAGQPGSGSGSEAQPEPDYMAAFRKVDLVAQISSACPPGSYLGFLELQSTAKSPDRVPFLVTVPSRYLVEPEMVKASMRKQGFLFNKPGSITLDFEAGARVKSNFAMDFTITVEPGDAVIKGGKERLAAKQINDGQPLKLTVNSGAESPTKATLRVDIPADTPPGIYEGDLKLCCTGQGSIAGPAAIHYQIEILPSPWDEMGPLAIPILALLFLVLLAGAFMFAVSSGRRY